MIDMKAAEEILRNREDEIETLRDPSHIRNLSEDEFEEMFVKNHLIIGKTDCTEIPVSLTAWLALTNTPAGTSADIAKSFTDKIANGNATGFKPYRKSGDIYFNQCWLMMIGEKK